jgi:outer membrane biosynthesis protein TonB
MLHTAVEFEITDVFFIANLLATMGGRQTVKAGHITMAAAFKKLDPNQRGVGIHSQLDFHRVMGGLGFDLSTTDLGTRLNVDWIADVGKKLLEKRKSEQAEKELTKEKQETNKKDPPKEPSKEKPKTQKKRPQEKTTTENQPKKKLILTKKTGATPVDANKENSSPDFQ